MIAILEKMLKFYPLTDRDGVKWGFMSLDEPSSFFSRFYIYIKKYVCAPVRASMRVYVFESVRAHALLCVRVCVVCVRTHS